MRGIVSQPCLFLKKLLRPLVFIPLGGIIIKCTKQEIFMRIFKTRAFYQWQKK